MPSADPHSFSVHTLHDSRTHARQVEGATFEEAALAFVEDWHPAADPDGEVSVLVSDEHGRQQCFRVDVGTGEAKDCR